MTRRDEEGAATLLVVAMAGLLLFVGLALTGVAAIVRTHRSAQAAADLSALAGATAGARGRPPCAAAEQVARLNGGAMASCSAESGDVTVEVTVPGPQLVGRDFDVTAMARAGPR